MTLDLADNGSLLSIVVAGVVWVTRRGTATFLASGAGVVVMFWWNAGAVVCAVWCNVWGVMGWRFVGYLSVRGDSWAIG